MDQSHTNPPTDSPEPIQQELALQNVESFPYPAWTYAARVLWTIVWATLWKISFKRISFLRPLVLRCFGAKIPLHAHIAGSVRIEFPWDLEVGHTVAMGPRTYLYNLGGLSIGSSTVLSQDVYVCGGTHDYTDPSYPLIRKKIVIGSNVWIAAGAFIGPGVTIGDGAVVGARAVVMKDVPPWTVVAGNPARVIKPRIIRSKPDRA